MSDATMETTLNGVLNGDNSTRKTYPSASSELSASYSEASNETDKTTSTDVQSTTTNTRHDNINDDTSIESSEDWIDVLGNSCLLKKIIKNGEGVSTRPSQRSQVAMRVRSFLPDGTVVDRHSSLLFTVGDHDVIQAIDIVANLMEKGEVCMIKTDAIYAYGTVGRSPDIPANSSLTCELELLEVRGPFDTSTVTEANLIAHLNKKRGRGNDLFQRKEYPQAVQSYGRAVEIIRSYKDKQGIDELSPEVTDLLIRCLNNLTAAQLKIELYDEALMSAHEVLKLDPNNVKALYRCGKVLLIKGECDEAVQNLQRASDLSPDERAIQTELAKALRKRNQHRSDERALYKRMIDGPKPKETSPSPSSSSSSSSSKSWKGILLGAGVVALLAVGVVFVMSKYKK